MTEVNAKAPARVHHHQSSTFDLSDFRLFVWRNRAYHRPWRFKATRLVISIIEVSPTNRLQTKSNENQAGRLLEHSPRQI